MEKRARIVERFATCFRDHRAAGQTAHTVRELVAQRVYGLALGYEDLNDHEQLRRDLLLAALADKADPMGESRAQRCDCGTHAEQARYMFKRLGNRIVQQHTG